MSKQVLIVDDSKVIRQMVAGSIKELDCVITEAEDGEQGIMLLESHRFDLIITDLYMPNMGGLEFLSFIKHHAENKFAKVIILTTEMALETKKEAKALGASGFVAKPFDPNTIMKTVNKLIS